MAIDHPNLLFKEYPESIVLLKSEFDQRKHTEAAEKNREVSETRPLVCHLTIQQSLRRIA